jgi:hypothetical protein
MGPASPVWPTQCFLTSTVIAVVGGDRVPARASKTFADQGDIARGTQGDASGWRSTTLEAWHIVGLNWNCLRRCRRTGMMSPPGSSTVRMVESRWR